MNMQSRSDSYAAAGVDITAGYRAVELMKTHIAKTMTAGALSDIGGFGGLFELDLTGISRPVLVSGTDGVGTKLKLAFLMDKHDTVGIDCVAMCVNDVACAGGEPLDGRKSFCTISTIVLDSMLRILYLLNLLLQLFNLILK